MQVIGIKALFTGGFSLERWNRCQNSLRMRGYYQVKNTLYKKNNQEFELFCSYDDKKMSLTYSCRRFGKQTAIVHFEPFNFEDGWHLMFPTNALPNVVKTLDIQNYEWDLHSTMDWLLEGRNMNDTYLYHPSEQAEYRENIDDTWKRKFHMLIDKQPSSTKEYVNRLNRLGFPMKNKGENKNANTN